MLFLFCLEYSSYVQRYTLFTERATMYKVPLRPLRLRSTVVQSSSAGMRQTLQAHGVMRDSSSSCHNKLIPASLTSYPRQSSELGASAQGRSCRATVRARRTVTPVLMEGLLGDEDDDASGRDVSPALKLLVLCGGSESAPPAGRHACILTGMHAYSHSQLSTCLTCLCYLRNTKNEL